MSPALLAQRWHRLQGSLINNSAIGSFDAFALVNQPAKYNFTLSDGVRNHHSIDWPKISGSSKQNTRFGFRMGIQLQNVPGRQKTICGTKRNQSCDRIYLQFQSGC